MKKNVIKFIANNKHVAEVREKPQPAAKYIPDWWKHIPKYSNEKNQLELNPSPSLTVKQCAPVIDVFTSGYIIPLWSDIFVSQTEFGPEIQWSTKMPVAETWNPNQSSFFKPPKGFNKKIFKYLHEWKIKTSPGWSCLFLHPVAHQDLPIRSIPGVVDTDILNTLINCPFFIEDGFEGIIEKGTPMVQVIPFKRENWVSKFEEQDFEQSFFDLEKLHSKIQSAYSSIRVKKTFK